MKLTEQNIIGVLLCQVPESERILEMLEPPMFTDALLGKMFYELKEAYKQGKVGDIAYLEQVITDYPKEILQNELLEIAQASPLGFEAVTDAKTLVKDYQARQVNKILETADVKGSNVEGKIDELVTSLNQISRSEANGKSLSEIAEAHKTNCFVPKEEGITIGLTMLDADLGGLERGDLITIGARPAVGKTAFSLQIGDHMAGTGKKVLMFNLEMTEEQIYQRMVARKSGIPLYRIRTAQKFMNDEEEIRFSQANEELAAEKNFVIVTGGQTVSDIRKTAKTQKPDVVIVDYLQLIKAESYYKGNRYAEVGQISHDLKAVARDLNIPVIVLTQLNRKSEGREDKEPTMGEIRESGDIEQDASVILLMWNNDKDDYTKKGVKLEKNRQGTLGKYQLEFDGSAMTFRENWEEPEASEEELPFEPDKE